MKKQIWIGWFVFLVAGSAFAEASAVRAEVDAILDESAADYAGDLSVEDAVELVNLEEAQLSTIAADESADRATVRGFLREYRAGKKEYRAWKREHREEAKTFLKSVAGLRKSMRRNPENHAAIASIKDECGMSAECASARMSATLEAALPKSEKMHKVVCNAADREGTPNWHLILYGKSECDDGDLETSIRTLGPGLYGGQLEANVFFCTGDARGKTAVGPYAQAAFGYFGTRLGFLFGGPGVCVNFNYTFGFGASAGLMIVRFGKE